MGQKHVTVNNINIVQEIYDTDNGNVPNGALPITDAEMVLISQGDVAFSDFMMVAGALTARPEAANNRKQRTIEGFNPEMMKAFVGLLIDEINILRATQSLPDRTLAQFQTAMKNKLT